MTSSCLFSIVTVVFNNREALERTACSISSQNYSQFEWIVIDGGSSDGTQSIINRYNEFINHSRSEPDEGIYDAMNKGIEIASGDFVIFLNAGDVFEAPESLEIVADEISNSNDIFSMVCASARYQLPNGTAYIQYPRDIGKTIWHGLPTSHQAMFFNIKDVEKTRFDVSYRVAGDYFLTAKYYELGMPVLNLNCVAVRVELGGDSFSNRYFGILFKDCYRIQRTVLGYSRFMAAISYLRRVVSRIAVGLLETRIFRRVVLYLMRFMKSKKYITPNLPPNNDK